VTKRGFGGFFCLLNNSGEQKPTRYALKIARCWVFEWLADAVVNPDRAAFKAALEALKERLDATRPKSASSYSERRHAELRNNSDGEIGVALVAGANEIAGSMNNHETGCGGSDPRRDHGRLSCNLGWRDRMGADYLGGMIRG